MSLFTAPPKPMTLTLRVCAHLLGYPDAALRAHLPELRAALREESALGASRLHEIERLIDHIGSRPQLQVEAAYVELFDRGRGTALHLFEHVHGDSRDRGPAMVDLIKTYEEAGLLLASGELPDHLSVVLQYASTQPGTDAKAFLGEISHILQAIFTALHKRNSGYACVLAGLLELAGEKAHAITVPLDDDLDEAWAEPAAFDGCSTAGQAAPGPVTARAQSVTIADWQADSKADGVTHTPDGTKGQRTQQRGLV